MPDAAHAHHFLAHYPDQISEIGPPLSHSYSHAIRYNWQRNLYRGNNSNKISCYATSVANVFNIKSQISYNMKYWK